MTLSEAKMEDLRADALDEMADEAESYDHYENHVNADEWEDECWRCRENLADEAAEADEADA